MSEGQRLLDVFVSVRPDPEMLEAVKAAHEALLSDLQKRLAEFNTAIGADTSNAINKVATAVGKLAASMEKVAETKAGNAIADANAQAEKYSETADRLRENLADAAKSQAALNTATSKANAAGGAIGSGLSSSGSAAPPPQPPAPKTQAELEVERISERRAGIQENIKLLREANSLEIARLRALGQKEFASPYEQQNRELRAIVLLMKAMDAEEVDLLSNDVRRQEYLNFYSEVGRRVDNARESVERFANRARQVPGSAVSQPDALIRSKIQEDIAKLFRAQNIRAGIALGAPQGRVTGLPSSGALADDLRAQEQVVRENAANVKKLRSEYDGTKNSVDRLRDAIDELANSQKRLNVLQLAAKDQGNLYRGVAEGARDASIAAGRLSISLKEIGDIGLRDDIVQLRRDFQDFERELTRLQSKGEFNFVVQSSGLTELLNRLETLTARSGTATTSKEKIVSDNEDLRASIRLDEIRVQALNEKYISRTTAIERSAIVSQKEALAINQAKIQEINRDRDNSIKKEQELNGLLIQRQALLGALSQNLESLADRTNASFNRLQNTAFQAGQAFEDFAVGFQLNGFAGGIRGAANNISFIAQDLASVYVDSEKISQKWKLIAGLGTGIGAALAVTILPLVIEWLENLNDIEVELADISKRMKDVARESELVAEFNQNTRETIDQIAESDSLESVLDTMRDLRLESEKLSNSVVDTLRSLADQRALEDFRKGFSDVLDGVRQQIARLINPQDIDILPDALPLGFLDDAFFAAQRALREKQIAEELANSNELIDNYLELNRQIDAAFAGARRGVFDSAQLKDIEDRFGELADQVDAFAKSADVANQEFAKNARENIAPLQKLFEGLRESAREYENLITQRLIAATEAAIQKSEQLERRQKLIRREINGEIDAGAQQAIEIDEMSQQYQDMIDATLEFYKRSGAVRADQIDQLRAALQQQANLELGNAALKEEKDLVDKIRAAEEKLDGIRNKRGSRQSQVVRPEEFLQQIQTAVLSIEPVDKNTDALEKATKEIADLNFQLQRMNRLQAVAAEEAVIRERAAGGPLLPRDAQRFRELQDIRRQVPLIARPAEDIPGPFNPLRELPIRAALRDEVRLGVQDAIQQGLRDLAPNLFKSIDGVGEAVRKKDLGARAQ